jgi:uncharacterized membrane protein YphA (DoxX/SURF4 family)
MPLNIDVSWANRVAKAILLIRVLVGWVFLSEGIQKFLFPDSLGVGRFVKIGSPYRRSWLRLSAWLRLLWLSAVDWLYYAAGDGAASH